MDKYNFYTGKEFYAQDWLGAHVRRRASSSRATPASG